MKGTKNRNIDWELLAKYLCGESTAKENALVKEWESLDEENRKLLHKLRDRWKKIQDLDEDPYNTEDAWKNVRFNVTGKPMGHQLMHNGETRKPVHSLSYFARIAAVIVLLLGSSYLIISRFSAITTLITGRVTVVADPASSKTTYLPDGSQVQLNASSRIVYKENRNEHTRTVSLTGEAFFDVRHDTEKPFIVTAGNAIVRVTGTSFNIRAEEGASQVSVFVESGTVEVSCSCSALSPVMLGACFSGVVTASGVETLLAADPNLLSWKTKSLVFKETPIAEVLEALNHTYHTNITCREEQILDYHFTGNFNDQPVDTILQVLCTAFSLEAKTGDDSVELRLMD